MKNLMIFVSPKKSFSDGVWENEAEKLIKIQIDNSLELGWKREDIILVTNFPYNYNGIKAVEVGDESICEFSPTASKFVTIIGLFEKGLIGDDLYWFHDLDAFQLEWITKDELNMGNADFGYTEYGITTINEKRNYRPSTGTVFFTNKARDVFELIMWKAGQYKCNEEVSFLELIKMNKHHIRDRIKKLNITYNFATRKRNIAETYGIADKPIKVLHFHPFDKRNVDGDSDNLAALMYGKNKLGRVFMNPRLIRIFNEHGIS